MLDLKPEIIKYSYVDVVIEIHKYDVLSLPDDTPAYINEDCRSLNEQCMSISFAVKIA